MINWGVLGLGQMGMRFVNSIEDTSNAKLLNIASKSGKTFKNYDKTKKKYDYSEVFNPLEEIISSVDFAIANLEVTLAGQPYMGPDPHISTFLIRIFD